MNCQEAFETCACGATIKVAAKWATEVRDRLKEWREGHKHWPQETRTVGDVSVSRPILYGSLTGLDSTESVTSQPIPNLIT